MRNVFLIFLFLCSTSQVFALDGLTLDLTDSEQHPTFNLQNSSIATVLITESAIKLRNIGMEKKFQTELSEFTALIRDSINTRNRVGYLLRVEYYLDEHGTPTIPDGQLVYPVGVSSDPVGALAEFNRPGVIRNPPRYGMRDMSYYIWIENGTALKATVIRKQYRKSFEKQANLESRRRTRASALYKDNDIGGKLQRAQYWKEQLAIYDVDLTKSRIHAKVSQLSRQMEESEKKLNDILKTYNEKLKIYNDESKRLDQLSKLQNVSRLLNAASDVGSLFSSNKPVNTSTNPKIKIEDEIDGYKREITIKGNKLDIKYEQITKKIDTYMQTDRDLNKLYEKSGLPIPNASPHTPVYPERRKSVKMYTD